MELYNGEKSVAQPSVVMTYITADGLPALNETAVVNAM